MAQLSKEQVVAKIRQVLAKHGAGHDVRLSSTPAIRGHEIHVELGFTHIDNDELIDDLNAILWNDTSEVEVCPCREVHAQGKVYL